MTLRIALAQFDFPVGDIAGNARRIADWAAFRGAPSVLRDSSRRTVPFFFFCSLFDDAPRA